MMDQYGATASANAGAGAALSEPEFQRLAQNIGTNIQKILQNGEGILIVLTRFLRSYFSI